MLDELLGMSNPRTNLRFVKIDNIHIVAFLAPLKRSL